MMRIKLIKSRRFFASRTSSISAEVTVYLDTIIGGVMSQTEVPSSDEKYVSPNARHAK